jgi:hypothetical protein
MSEVRVIVLVVWLLYAILFTALIVGPVMDLQYGGLDSTNVYYSSLYGWVWWPVALLIGFNYVSLFILLSILMDPNNPARVDIHQIVNLITLVLNILLFALVWLFYYFIYINTSFSGGEPLNSDVWCCRYYPTRCPNTIACTPEPAQLSPSYQFTAIWIITILMSLFTALMTVANRWLRRSGAVAPPSKGSREGYVLGLFYIFLVGALYTYWVAWPLFDTIHTNGYPTMGVPPSSPGTYKSHLYNYLWVQLMIISFNLIPLLAFGAALIAKGIFVDLHMWSQIIMSLANVIVFMILLISMIPYVGYCNSAGSGGSICNDYQWCGKYFADAIDYCANIMPITGIGWLLPNGEYVQHLLLSLLFSVTSGYGIWTNYRMKAYGIFVK